MKKLILILLFIPLVSFGQSFTTEIDLNNEKSIRDYIDETGTEGPEGIWVYTDNTGSTTYRLWILQVDYKYQAFIIEETEHFNVGDLKAVFENSSDNTELITTWTMTDKTKSTYKSVLNEERNIIELERSAVGLLLAARLTKVYPKKY